LYKLTHAQLAWRVAQDLPRSSHVYLGAGLPLGVPAYTRTDSTVAFSTHLRAAASATPDLYVFAGAQVSERGDLSLRVPPDADTSRALALAATAPQVLVVMDFFAADGSATLVPLCTGPLAQECCVTRVYTDIAVFDLKDGKVILCEIIEGITLLSLQMELEIDLLVSPHLGLIKAPTLK
jgi:acyl CoA:acetate/3-ketoacid CoA transferase beta subunit